MQFKFGSTTIYGSDILDLSVTQHRRLSKLKRNSDVVHRWILTGRIVANSVSNLNSAMETISGIDGSTSEDITVTDNSGTDFAGHSMEQTSTKYGIFCTGLEWVPLRHVSNVPGSQSEYLFVKGYRLMFEAETFDSTSNIVDWHESLSQFGGGGNNSIYETSMTGNPQLQDLNQYTPIRIIQQGYSVGLEDYVDWPDPLFPDHKVSLHTRYRQESPVFYANKNLIWPRSWTFVSIHQNHGDIPAGTLIPPNFG